MPAPDQPTRSIAGADPNARIDGASNVQIAPVAMIETPTLFIWGENDRALGKELTYGTDQYVRNLQTEYLPGISHWVQQEASGEVNRLLAAHLAANASRA